MDTFWGCLGLSLVLFVMVYVDWVRWTPLRPKDHIGPMVWLGWSALGAASVHHVWLQGWRPDVLDQVGLGAVLFIHAMWGLRAGWRPDAVERPTRAWSAAGICVAMAAVFGWLFGSQPEAPIDWAHYQWLLNLELSEPTQALQLVGLATVGFGALHVPAYKARESSSGKRRLAGKLLGYAHFSARLLCWLSLVAVLIVATCCAFDIGWDLLDPDSRGKRLMILGGQTIGAVLLLNTLYAFGLLLNSDPWNAERFQQLSLTQMQRDTRPRMAYGPRRASVTDAWGSIFPTVGVPFFVVAFALGWAQDQPAWMATTVVAAFVSVVLSAFWAYQPRAPFSPTIVDLERKDRVEAIDGLQWHERHGLLVDPEHFQPLPDDPPRAGDADPREAAERAADMLSALGTRTIYEGRAWFALRSASIQRIGLTMEKAQPTSEVKPEDDDDDDGDDEPLRPWRLTLSLEGAQALHWTLPAELREERRIKLIADLWFLASKLGCSLRLPHRQLPKAQWRTNELDLRTLNDHLAFELPEHLNDQAEPDVDEAAEETEAEVQGDDAGEQESAKAARTPQAHWGRCEDAQGQRWWLAPTRRKALQGGLWWLYAVSIIATLEGAGAALHALETWGPVALAELVPRAALVPMLWAETFKRRMHIKAPSVFCVAVKPAGLQLHQHEVPWDALVDINTLPVTERGFPLILVTDGRVIGLPCPLDHDQRLKLAADIGEALRRHNPSLRLSTPG